VTPVPWQWSERYQAMAGADSVEAARATQWLTWQTDEPWFSSMFAAGPMETALERALMARPDLVLLEGTPVARFLPSLPHGIPRVLDLFDVHSVLASRAVDAAGAGDRAAVQREAERTLAFERAAVRACDACLAVSPQEAEAARRLLRASTVHVVPNGVDTSFFRPSVENGEPDSIVFTGRMSYRPNADAVCYFARQILPRITREVPAARLHVVGAAPPSDVSGLASASVVVHGQVDDVRPFLARAAVAVVPILTGGGTRLKVLEAAASGKAIVSTALGIEGLTFENGRDVVVADDPAAFAQAVIALLRDPDRRAALGAAARQTATGYDWHPIGVSFRHILEEIQSRP
jgi:polysaccharide biosynthesis protein PslH